MPEQKFTIAEQDLVDIYRPEIREILAFLGMDLEECLVTDESSISDFSLCYPASEEPADSLDSYMDAVNRWDAWLEQAWPRHFPNVKLGTTHTEHLLVNIAARIRESRCEK